MKTFKEFLIEKNTTNNKETILNENVKYISSSKAQKDAKAICKKYAKALEILKNA